MKKEIVVLGSLNVDYVFRADHAPVAGETLLASDLSLFPGGKGANQAYALGRMGAKVSMLGAVGRDSNGDLELESLSSAGVDVSGIERFDCPTAIAAITVNKEGNNSILVAPGANNRVDRGYVDRHMEIIRRADVLVLQLEIPLDTVLYAASAAKAMGKTVILDPAPVAGPLPEELIRCADILKPNEIELEVLTGLPAEGENLQAACEQLHRQGARCVLASLGNRGAVLAEQGKPLRHFPCEKVQAVDTTAAGDSFTAAVAYALASGRELEPAIRFAGRVAGVVVTRKGAQTSIPTSDEIQELFQR